MAAIEETVAGWAAEWAARPRLRGWQHALAILPAAAGAATLAARATNRRERVAAVAWGAGIVGMLTASASYHRLPRSERTAKVLRRLDHAAIWGAVAGTWTPIALAVLPGRAGTVHGRHDVGRRGDRGGGQDRHVRHASTPRSTCSTS